MQRRAFTLIELLVVVAIIAILAAIAIPNMLEAQMRAKVSRTKSDLRTIATGLESYAVDNNRYPPNYDTGYYGFWPGSEYLTYAAITTPVAYISNTPTDVFRPDPKELERKTYFEYVGADTVLKMTGEYDALTREYYASSGTKWSIASVGPDKTNQLLGRKLHEAWLFTYDPTNGTVSAGDFGRTNKGAVPGDKS